MKERFAPAQACVAGTLVDDRVHHALSMVDGAWEVEGGNDRQVIQRLKVAMTLVDLEADQAGAIIASKVNLLSMRSMPQGTPSDLRVGPAMTADAMG